MSIIKRKRLVFMQLFLFLFLLIVFVTFAALSYDNGLIEEEPFLSENPESDAYYMKVLNSEASDFACQVGYELYVEDTMPNAGITMVSGWSEMISRLQYGKTTAIAMEESSKYEVLKNVPTLYFFDEPLCDSQYCFATAKSEWGNQLCLKLNQFLADIRASGEYDRLLTKWNEGESEEIQTEPMEYAKDAKTLKIPIDPDWLPFSFVLDANEPPTGFFVDLMNAFCAENGYAPEYVPMLSVDACMVGLNSGAYDIGAIGFIKTEEKEESVTMSDVVVDDIIYVCVRASSVIGLDLEEYVKDQSFWDTIGRAVYRCLVEYDRWQILLQGLGVTILISCGSIFLGTLLGAGLYFLWGRKNLFLSSIGRLYVNVFQRMPQVLLLLIMFYIAFSGVNVSGILVCILTFALSFAPFVTEMLRSGVEAIPEGQWKAALALGFTKPQTFVKIILPQVIQLILPVYKANVVSMFLESSIAGYISVEDLTMMSDYIRASTLEPMTPMLISALIYFLLTLGIGALLDCITTRMNPKSRRQHAEQRKLRSQGSVAAN